MNSANAAASSNFTRSIRFEALSFMKSSFHFAAIQLTIFCGKSLDFEQFDFEQFDFEQFDFEQFV